MFITIALIDLGTFKEIHDLFDDHIIDIHLLSDCLCLLSSSPHSARSPPDKFFTHFPATAFPYCLNGRRERKENRRRGRRRQEVYLICGPKAGRAKQNFLKNNKKLWL
jgi:hypothetical protein